MATIWIIGRSPILVRPESTAILRGIFVAAWVTAGTYMWWRRPDSRLGLLVASAAFIYAGTSIIASGDELVYTIGRVGLAAFVVYLCYVFLCFPHDRIDSVRERWFLAGLSAATIVSWGLVLAFAVRLPRAGAFSDCRRECPDNALRVFSVSNGLSEALSDAVGVVTAAALAGIAIVIVSKARSRSRLRRRAVEPLLYASAVVIGAYVLHTLVHPTGNGFQALRAADAAAVLVVPIAMLAGQAQARAYAAVALGRLVASVRGERVTQPRMQELLRDALGDPSLQVALWDRQRLSYVDVGGDAFDTATTRPGRAITTVTHDGRPAAALEHNALLGEAAGVLEGLAETALVLLENTRLVEELRASRARIVASADRERHRLERDLHDGAQQRLILLQMKIGLLQKGVRGALVERLEELQEDAVAALEELRVLAHGIYPTVLLEQGLPDALRAFARDAAIPVEVIDRGIGRCSRTVEAAVYYCALEAIQNAAKHAGPDARVTVHLDRDDDAISFAVADDGQGFREGALADGVGFVTMRDRIGAIRGELEISSEPGGGVTVRGIVAEAPAPERAGSEEPSRWRSE